MKQLELLLALLAVVLLMVVGLISCGHNIAENINTERDVVKTTDGIEISNIFVDTLTIHGHSHEMIYYRGYHRGSMTHSPECWCLKEGEEL